MRSEKTIANVSMGSPSEEERAISPERRSKPWDRKDRSRSPFRRDYGPRGRSRSPNRSDLSYRGRSRSPSRRAPGSFGSGRSPTRRGLGSSLRSRSPPWRFMGPSDRSRSPLRREVGYRRRSPSYRRSRSRSREFRERRFRRPRSPSPYNEDGYRGGFRSRNWDLSPRPYDRVYGDSDSYGRHRRSGPEYLVSNYDFDNPINSSLNYPPGPDYGHRPDLPDPLELPELVSIDYYADYLRISEPNERHSDSSIQKRYKIYQDLFNSRLIATFFKDHQAEPWFKEKYFPSFVKQRIEKLRPGRIAAYKQFLIDLKAGIFDEVCYDVGKKDGPNRDEDRKNPSLEGSSTNGKSTNSDQPQVVPEKEASAGERQQPEQLQTIFIKSVPPSLAREQLLKVFENEEGFCHLMVSEPNPFKRFHRIAWALFTSTVNVEQIVEKLDKTTIDEFALHLAVHKQKQTPRLTNEIANTARRLNIDNHQAQKLARLFEKELGEEFNASPEIEERLVVLFRKNRAENQGEPNEDIWETKKTLDVYLCYLRKVFSFCYYCSLCCDNDIELQRRCLDNHLRTTPRSSLNRPGEAWADALDAKVERKLMPDDDPDLELLGGKDLPKAIDEAVVDLIEEIGDTKFRCKSCSKLFKAIEFVKKHVKTKHPETFSDVTDQALFLNNYVRDPNRILPVVLPVADQLGHGMGPSLGPGVGHAPHPPGFVPYNQGFPYPPINHPGIPIPVGPPIRMGFPDSEDQAFSANLYSGPRYKDPPRLPPQGARPPVLQKDPRQLKSYVDLDAPTEGDMEFSYT